jgi:hypothetical protein
MGKVKGVLFKAGAKTHRADDCLPLVSAVQEGRMALQALARGHYPGERLKAAEVPGVCSLGYWQTLGDVRRGLAPHRNEGIEVTMPLQGETPVMVDGKAYVLLPGEVMITRPWQLHSVGEPCFAKGKVGCSNSKFGVFVHKPARNLALGASGGRAPPLERCAARGGPRSPSAVSNER